MKSTLETNFASLCLDNPLVIASCPATEDRERLCRCGEAGASAAILKSCRTVGLVLESGKRRFGSSKNGYWGTSARGRELAHPEAIGELITSTRCHTEMILIPSVAGVSLDPEPWVETLKYLETFQPACIQLDLFYLNEELSLPESQERLGQLVTALRAITNIPLLPKLNVELRPAAAHQALADKGITGWSVLDSVRCPSPTQTEGVSIGSDVLSFTTGAPSASFFGVGQIQHTRHYVQALRQRSALPILAGGGIETADDIRELLRLGANAVQVASPVLREGPEWIRRTLKSLRRQSEIDIEATTINSGSKTIFHPAQAKIAPELCQNCGRCMEQLMCSAIQMDDNQHPSINHQMCEGCGFCRTICPAKAIELVPIRQ